MNSMIDYQTETLVDIAYKEIKKDIALQVLKPGQKMIIRELQERYSLSPTPIKQALNRMVAEGLVTCTPRRGMSVRAIEWKEVADLMEIRTGIESFYVPQMMEYVKENPEFIGKLQANIQEHKKAVGSSDVQSHLQDYRLDEKFHLLLMQCSGNQRVMQLFQSMGTHGYSSHIYGKQSNEKRLCGVLEHEAICQSLETADEEGLRYAIVSHLDNAKGRIFEMLVQNEQGQPKE